MIWRWSIAEAEVELGHGHRERRRCLWIAGKPVAYLDAGELHAIDTRSTLGAALPLRGVLDLASPQHDAVTECADLRLQLRRAFERTHEERVKAETLRAALRQLQSTEEELSEYGAQTIAAALTIPP